MLNKQKRQNFKGQLQTTSILQSSLSMEEPDNFRRLQINSCAQSTFYNP